MGSRMLARSGPCRTPRARSAISAPLSCSCRSSTAVYSSRCSAWRNDANSRQVDAAKGRCRQRRNATGTMRRRPGWSVSSGTNPVSATQSIARSGRCARTSLTIASAWTMSPRDEGRMTSTALKGAPLALRAVPPRDAAEAAASRARDGRAAKAPAIPNIMRACSSPAAMIPWNPARAAAAGTRR